MRCSSEKKRPFPAPCLTSHLIDRSLPSRDTRGSKGSRPPSLCRNRHQEPSRPLEPTLQKKRRRQHGKPKSHRRIVCVIRLGPFIVFCFKHVISTRGERRREVIAGFLVGHASPLRMCAVASPFDSTQKDRLAPNTTFPCTAPVGDLDYEKSPRRHLRELFFCRSKSHNAGDQKWRIWPHELERIAPLGHPFFRW